MSKELEIVRKLQHCGVEEYRIALEKVEQIILEYEQIKNANPSEALEYFETISIGTIYYDECNIIKQALIKAQEQKKENELLKEIIKSLFDRGCPLHQYIDSKGILQIEVDNECSIMHLGKYKDIDLDKKLKEVLNNDN